MDGILPLWKERGMTSHDCVFKLRKILQTKKVGHGGTLDPDVEGILPICIGKGTKVIEFLTDSGKVYEGEITLGFSTTTEDKSGEVVEQKAVLAPLTTIEIDEKMASMVGEITQIPPMYSAVKVNGRKLYEYERNNEEVERPIRKAVITSFERTTEPVFDQETQTQSWYFKVACGKGTYVRTLAVDLGKALGYPAHMSDLVRTQSGGFTKAQALTLSQVQEAKEENRLEDFILPIEYGVKKFDRVDISDRLYQQVKNGMRLDYTVFGLQHVPSEPIALFYQENVVSLYYRYDEKTTVLKPLKVFRND